MQQSTSRVKQRERTVSLVRDYLEGSDSATRNGAFSRLYELHADVVLRSVERQLGRRLREWVAPADILQEAFIGAWREIRRHGFRKYETVGRFGRLVARIAVHRICDYSDEQKAIKRGGSHPSVSSDADLDTTSPLPSPVETAAGNELEEMIDAVVLGMDERDRQILDCCTFHGLSHAEASEELGTSAAAAKHRHRYARQRLLRQLPSEYADAVAKKLE